MKKLLFIALLGTISTGAFAQNDAITKYFSNYWDDEDFTTVYITSRMFELVAEIPQSENEDEVMSVIRSLDGMRFLAADRNGDNLYTEAVKMLDSKGYDELMVLRDKGQDMQFLVLESGAKISELVLVSRDQDSDKDFFILSLTGDIDLKQIAKLSSTLDIDGMEYLEELDDNDE